MSKLIDLRDAALSDQARVLSDLDTQAKANAAVEASEDAEAISTPAFGREIAKRGGIVLDPTVSPAVFFTAPADGSTFTRVVPPLITDDAPEA